MCYQTPLTSKGWQTRVWNGCCSPGSGPLLLCFRDPMGGTRRLSLTTGTQFQAPMYHRGRTCPQLGCWEGTGRHFRLLEQLVRMSQPITSGKEVSGKAVTPRLWHPAVEGQMWRPTHVRCRCTAN